MSNDTLQFFGGLFLRLLAVGSMIGLIILIAYLVEWGSQVRKAAREARDYSEAALREIRDHHHIYSQELCSTVPGTPKGHHKKK